MPAEPEFTHPAATSLVERLRAVHLQMLDAVLTGDGLAAVATLAAEAAGGPVAIVVPRLGVAVVSPGGEASLDAVRRYVGRASRPAAAWRRCRCRRTWSPRCRSRPATSGSAASCCSSPGGRSPRRSEFLHLAAVAALTEVAVEEAREEVEENVRGSFLEELRERPDGLDPVDVVRRAGRLGCDVSTRRRGACAPS